MKRQLFSLCAICIAAACADVQAPPVAPEYASVENTDEYELVDFGTFNGEPVHAFDIDDRGTAYGRWGQFPGPNGSFRWTEKGGFEDLGGLDGMPFLILGVNKHQLLTGSVPAGPPPSRSRAAVLLPHSGLRYIDDADHFGAAWGVNKHGVVVGIRQLLPPSPQQALMWSEKDGMSVLPIDSPTDVAAGSTVGFAATRINDRGTVLGTASYRPIGAPRCCRSIPYLWDAARGTRWLPTLSGGNTGVTGLNESEFVTGAAETRLPLLGERRLNNPMSVQSQVSDVPIHAWRWSPARGLEDLSTLGGKHSVSWGVDQYGNAFGWADDASGGRHAVKWPVGGGIIRLPDLGGNSMADPPNKHGVLPGQATTLGGERRGVLWVPAK